MKYPKKFKGKKEYITIPVEIRTKVWRVGEIDSLGRTLQITGIADHNSEKSCWIVCRAHNGRVGYSDKKVDKFLNKIKDVKEEKRKKSKKLKGKKAKKQKGKKSKKRRG